MYQVLRKSAELRRRGVAILISTANKRKRGKAKTGRKRDVVIVQIARRERSGQDAAAGEGGAQ